MSTQRYGRGAMLLHWGHAVLVLGMIGWGLYMADLPKGPDRSFAIGVHKSFGIVAILVVAVRLLWRRSHPAPVDLRLSRAEHKLAAAGHHLLYLLLVLTPLAGYLSASFTQYPMRFFGIVIPKPGWPDEGINAFFNASHGFLAWSLMGVIGIHLAAVVLHSIKKKPVLGRMLPGSKPID
ncbi:MAG: cytochrome B [Betaproteobacteria bacterium HGW-Betaproteobacteria-13]|jgi:cytochrome b561|uniref:Cytochrome B n=1 Tax=Parazoarcus communis TaxID=41977 RepID=A0A2U8H882_9RHOO|nr:cytochrome b [Parazoarcus communis]AWI81790.1 cytochrome B [Parazoarcus communis]PKO57033.1 MAG: cytochrome B [Betaproteobacteria bacterium HGW-Betaproteobacteria-21]PKO79998.1 MAG: cytochrome B [Betaproteobacteria bacterium HGW-Betaproteobacteria-13]